MWGDFVNEEFFKSAFLLIGVSFAVLALLPVTGGDISALVDVFSKCLILIFIIFFLTALFHPNLS
mgnify:CR=1 FL=1